MAAKLGKPVRHISDHRKVLAPTPQTLILACRVSPITFILPYLALHSQTVAMESQTFHTNTTLHGNFPVTTYCRPADWTDVAKFFLANYFTHAFTVITRPGELIQDRIGFVIWSLFMPFAGVSRAIAVICMCARAAGDDLAMAHRAGALYTLVKVTRKKDGEVESEEPSTVIPGVHKMMLKRYLPPLILARYYHQWGVQVHGRHPKFPAKDASELYFPARVTQRHVVTALPYPTEQCCGGRVDTPNPELPKVATEVSVIDIETGTSPPPPTKHPEDVSVANEDSDMPTEDESTKQKICSQYNILKAALAIFQVLYGSWELYVARGKQLETYGYAAYSLTVVPPEYSHVYLVRYENAQSGPVEQKLNKRMAGAVGTICIDKKYKERTGLVSYFLNRVKVFRNTRTGERRHIVWWTTLNVAVGIILGICAYGAPYVVSYMLTKYQPASSTRLQRIWIIVWLVFGQILGLVAIVRRRSIFSFNCTKMVGWMFVVGPLVVVPGLGVFVIAARMIMDVGIFGPYANFFWSAFGFIDFNHDCVQGCQKSVRSGQAIGRD
ncbi:hypothetical protein K440DRAFT_639404 [Wilcoxina mikolae CBS 423.85]|nr:hypothetical protein K440DRAFT_639404 [Wilcoxina mikolae CBS 423.85]